MKLCHLPQFSFPIWSFSGLPTLFPFEPMIPQPPPVLALLHVLHSTHGNDHRQHTVDTLYCTCRGSLPYPQILVGCLVGVLSSIRGVAVHDARFWYGDVWLFQPRRAQAGLRNHGSLNAYGVDTFAVFLRVYPIVWLSHTMHHNCPSSGKCVLWCDYAVLSTPYSVVINNMYDTVEISSMYDMV